MEYDPNGDWGPLDLDLTVIEGDPDVQAQLVFDGEELGRSTTGFGKLQPSVFEITLEWDECLYVIEGDATLTVDGGESFELRPGAAAYIERGAHCHWTVREQLLEFYVLST